MATPERQELLRNAVEFLVDPKTQPSPLAQRVQFLEAKGLSGAEIEEAMRQAASKQPVARPAPQPYGPAPYAPVYGPAPYIAQPPQGQWDWRDYFITGVVSGTVAYGAVALFRKYVLPHLQPPSSTAYEADRDALTAQFDAAEALLKEIQAETAAVRTAVEEQNEKVAKVTHDVEEVVKEMREGEAQTRDEMREIRDEVNNVREMLPKMIEKNKESQTESLAELQQELKSLKALLLSRGPSTGSGFSTPVLPPKPSIPSWQLAGNSSYGMSSVPITPDPVATPSSAPVINGKGKENMFSQFRQAVESLAQHSPKPSLDSSAEDHASRSSQDSVRPSLSSSQLAEKTLTTQRSGSPGPGGSSPARTTSSPDGAARLAHRSTLEDRLRAKFAVGDASNSSSPITSSRTSPAPTVVLDHPLSPTSVPLPESPAPRADSTDPFHATSIPLPDSPAPEVNSSVVDISYLSLSEAASAVAGTGSAARPSEPESQFAEQQEFDPLRAVVSLERKQDAGESVVSDAHSLTNPEEVTDIVEDDKTPQPPLKAATPGQHSASQEDATNVQVDTPDLAGADSEHTPTSRAATAGEEEGRPPTATANEEEHYQPEEMESADEVSSETKDPTPGTKNAPTDVDSSVVVGKEGESTHEADAVDVINAVDIIKEVEATEGTDAVDGDNAVDADVTVPERKSSGLDVEALQKRLKLVEQRFADVSTSFKRLQAEKIAADRVLKELTPLETLQEADALRDYLQNMNMKVEMTQDEIKRLTGKLTRQDERIEELRDIHRLESKSQSDLIDKLRNQVEEAEALLKASHSSTTALEEESAKRKADIERLEREVEKAKGLAKEEEEKRVKAIALLKTVRQKLVKAEKERDDVTKEVQVIKEKDKEEREKEKAERLALQSEIQKLNAERETAILSLRSQFDKESAAVKEQYEREIAMLKGQYELEAIAAKASYTKELDTKNSRISELESSVQRLAGDKDELFDQLQIRQAELESSQSHLESLEGQCTELQYQLREVNDRAALLTEELAEAQREQSTKVHSAGPTPEEVTRLLSATEVKYESRISDLRHQLQVVERERDESEAEWSKKLSEKAKELEALKGTLTMSARSREQESESASTLKTEIEELKEEIRQQQTRIVDLQRQAMKVTETEDMMKMQLSDVNMRATLLQQHLEEVKNRESQLRAANKTMREELRKVQSSAALLERQRGPGVGYWAARQDSSSEARSPRSSIDTGSRPSSPSVDKSDEEVNIEYLRNIILQFLEHKEMRPHLVRILSTILRFTPQETRRLVAKV
ncbi:hypothetical protein OBBRIDRAFT_816376 [Obba rivulosa]|uniref:Peroxisomal membrane protein PEX14 n=1 Tax=Obba rivulosa TaxID=1052685 RepID=A0A8E2J6P0_9APHY|nr:hypothetical protein OBBRIDRAFT_816376 [Obba rivulosa]